MPLGDIEKLDRHTTSGQVVSILREKILTGEVVPGTPLRQVALASALGVSRNTLREALKTLERDGLIRYEPHRGVRVSTLAEKDVEEIYSARYAVESTAIPAVLGCDGDELDELESIVERMNEAAEAGDWARVVDADVRFHTWMVDRLGNRRLSDFLAGLWGELRIGLMLVDHAAGTVGIADAHLKLLDLIRGGDEEAMRQELALHLNESKERVREILGRADP